MAMEVEVLGVDHAPEGAVVSVRAGSQRKQAAVCAIGPGRTPFRISTGGAGLNPFKVDLLQPAGSLRLALKPVEGTYATELKQTGGGNSVVVRFAVREAGKKGKQPPPAAAVLESSDKPLDKPFLDAFLPATKGDRLPPSEKAGGARLSSLKQDDDMDFPSAAAAAKNYLEVHQLLPFVRSLLQTVVRDRPSDPYGFISDQFRNASAADVARSPDTAPVPPAPPAAEAAEAAEAPEAAEAAAPPPAAGPEGATPTQVGATAGAAAAEAAASEAAAPEPATTSKPAVPGPAAPDPAASEAEVPEPMSEAAAELQPAAAAQQGDAAAAVPESVVAPCAGTAQEAKAAVEDTALGAASAVPAAPDGASSDPVPRDIRELRGEVRNLLVQATAQGQLLDSLPATLPPRDGGAAVAAAEPTAAPGPVHHCAVETSASSGAPTPTSHWTKADMGGDWVAAQAPPPSPLLGPAVDAPAAGAGCGKEDRPNGRLGPALDAKRTPAGETAAAAAQSPASQPPVPGAVGAHAAEPSATEPPLVAELPAAAEPPTSESMTSEPLESLRVLEPAAESVAAERDLPTAEPAAAEVPSAEPATAEPLAAEAPLEIELLASEPAAPEATAAEPAVAKPLAAEPPVVVELPTREATAAKPPAIEPAAEPTADEPPTSVESPEAESPAVEPPVVVESQTADQEAADLTVIETVAAAPSVVVEAQPPIVEQTTKQPLPVDTPVLVEPHLRAQPPAAEPPAAEPPAAELPAAEPPAAEPPAAEPPAAEPLAAEPPAAEPQPCVAEQPEPRQSLTEQAAAEVAADEPSVEAEATPAEAMPPPMPVPDAEGAAALAECDEALADAGATKSPAAVEILCSRLLDALTAAERNGSIEKAVLEAEQKAAASVDLSMVSEVLAAAKDRQEIGGSSACTPDSNDESAEEDDEESGEQVESPDERRSTLKALLSGVAMGTLDDALSKVAVEKQEKIEMDMLREELGHAFVGLVKAEQAAPRRSSLQDAQYKARCALTGLFDKLAEEKEEAISEGAVEEEKPCFALTGVRDKLAAEASGSKEAKDKARVALTGLFDDLEAGKEAIAEEGAEEEQPCFALTGVYGKLLAEAASGSKEAKDKARAVLKGLFDDLEAGEEAIAEQGPEEEQPCFALTGVQDKLAAEASMPAASRLQEAKDRARSELTGIFEQPEEASAEEGPEEEQPCFALTDVVVKLAAELEAEAAPEEVGYEEGAKKDAPPALPACKGQAEADITTGEESDEDEIKFDEADQDAPPVLPGCKGQAEADVTAGDEGDGDEIKFDEPDQDAAPVLPGSKGQAEADVTAGEEGDGDEIKFEGTAEADATSGAEGDEEQPPPPLPGAKGMAEEAVAEGEEREDGEGIDIKLLPQAPGEASVVGAEKEEAAPPLSDLCGEKDSAAPPDAGAGALMMEEASLGDTQLPVVPEESRTIRLEIIRTSLKDEMDRQGYACDGKMVATTTEFDGFVEAAAEPAGHGTIILPPPSAHEQAAVSAVQSKLEATKTTLTSLNASLKDELGEMSDSLEKLVQRRDALRAAAVARPGGISLPTGG